MKLQLDEEIQYGKTPISELQQRAEEHNCTLIEGDDLHLLVDLDNASSVKQFNSLIANFDELIMCIEKWKSKGGNEHRYITLFKKTDRIERIAMQTILGGDPKQNMLALFFEQEIFLFKPKT